MGKGIIIGIVIGFALAYLIGYVFFKGMQVEETGNATRNIRGTCTECVNNFQQNLKGASQTIPQTNGVSSYSTPMLNNAITQLINCTENK